MDRRQCPSHDQTAICWRSFRKEVEPVDQTALGRFIGALAGPSKKRRGADALLDVIEQLQGAPLPASILRNRHSRVASIRTSLRISTR